MRRSTGIRSVAVAGLATALGLGGPVRVAAQRAGGGSDVPCAVPLAWRVARVDTEFRLDPSRATSVIQEAAQLWERAAGRTLFRHDARDGLPIRFVYDERQERTDERLKRQSEVDAASRRLEALRGAHGVRVGRYNEAAATHAERASALERRVAAHNDAVREWNGRGGAPEAVGAELRAVGEALETERQALETLRRPLEREREAIAESEREIADAAVEQERLATALARDFPPVPMESGEYREAIRREGGSLVSVGREIRIYRFADELELRWIAAHELGHALGVGHVDGVGALMAEEQRSGPTGGTGDGPTEADVAALAATCPALVRGNP